jgi:hypothetical protein
MPRKEFILVKQSLFRCISTRDCRFPITAVALLKQQHLGRGHILSIAVKR